MESSKARSIELGSFDIHEAVLASWASTVRDRFSQLTKQYLLEQGADLAGSDSGLKTLWDEWCVQIQAEQSPFWTDYRTIVDQAIEFALRNATSHELEAMWLQTDAGRAWVAEGGGHPPVPVHLQELAEWIYEDVERLALNDESRAVVRFLARSSE